MSLGERVFAEKTTAAPRTVFGAWLPFLREGCAGLDACCARLSARCISFRVFLSRGTLSRACSDHFRLTRLTLSFGCAESTRRGTLPRVRAARTSSIQRNSGNL